MSRSLALALTLPATALTAAPQATCLTAADLTRGIVVTFETGDRTIVRRTGDGTQVIDETYGPDQPAQRFRAWHGIYVVEEFELASDGSKVPGTGLAVEFGVDPATLPRPAAGVTWTGRTVNVFDGGDRRNETTSVAFRPLPPVTFGDCTYAALDAALTYDRGHDGALHLRYHYLPDLDTAILLSTQDHTEDMPQTVAPVALERLTAK